MAFNRSNSRGCPCKDCEKRTLTCHGFCEAYAEWKKAEAAIKEAREKERQRFNTMSDAKKKEIWRRNRYSRQQRNRHMGND